MAMSQEKFHLTQTQEVVESQQTRQGQAFKDIGVHARLTSLTDSKVVYELHKDQKEVEIGRYPTCFIKVNDKRASAHHLKIFRDTECRYYVEELSANGCFINKNFVKQGETRALQHGDEVSLIVYARSADVFAAYLFTLTGAAAATQAGSGTAASSSAPVVPTFGAYPASPSHGLVTQETVVARWDMRTVLGSGNFSEVRLGVNVKTGDRRAIKVINKKAFQQFQKKRDSRLALKSEAELLTSLNCPGIVKVFEYFETDQHLYLVMELLSDGDLLACILDHGLFTESQARRLFRQLCEAVRYLHTKNIVHRDLKPENILVNGKDRNHMSLKIADFGLAWKNMKSGDCQTFCGTPHYLSPEVINTFYDQTAGQPAGYGKQVDMWSLGVILYVMLSGVPPFEDEGLYEQICEGKFEFDVREWTAVSHEAKDLVKRMMTVSPSERVSIQQALDHPWLRFSPPASPCGSPPRGDSQAGADSRPSDEAMPCSKRRRASTAGDSPGDMQAS